MNEREVFGVFVSFENVFRDGFAVHRLKLISGNAFSAVPEVAFVEKFQRATVGHAAACVVIAILSAFAVAVAEIGVDAEEVRNLCGNHRNAFVVFEKGFQFFVSGAGFDFFRRRKEGFCLFVIEVVVARNYENLEAFVARFFPHFGGNFFEKIAHPFVVFDFAVVGEITRDKDVHRRLFHVHKLAKGDFGGELTFFQKLGAFRFIDIGPRIDVRVVFDKDVHIRNVRDFVACGRFFGKSGNGRNRNRARQQNQQSRHDANYET